MDSRPRPFVLSPRTPMTSMASKRDYYEVLGVARDAAPEQIKKAYKKLALANHPDRNPGDEAAVERFKEVSEAFEVLTDPERRARYDRYGHAGVQGVGGGAGFHDVGDFMDIFAEMFGGSSIFGGGTRTRGRARRGASLRTAMTIDLLEAATGVTRELELERHETCGTCDGSGAKPGTQPERCDYCGGRGQIVQSQGIFRIQTTCPACHGAGTVVRQKCPDCYGTGRTAEPVRLQVRVPAGVDNGMQLALRGEGESGDGGGPRGDLFVDIHVREHPLFQRDGKELICKVPITYSQAALGADLQIPILTGGRHELHIPAGTQPNETFRIRGKGMPDPHGGRVGDLHVLVLVEIPRKLSERQETLIRELAELEQADVSPHRKSFFEKVREFFTGDEESPA